MNLMEILKNELFPPYKVIKSMDLFEVSYVSNVSSPTINSAEPVSMQYTTTGTSPSLTTTTPPTVTCVTSDNISISYGTSTWSEKDNKYIYSSTTAA
jgi:hypothetical protein